MAEGFEGMYHSNIMLKHYSSECVQYAGGGGAGAGAGAGGAGDAGGADVSAGAGTGNRK